MSRQQRTIFLNTSSANDQEAKELHQSRYQRSSNRNPQVFRLRQDKKNMTAVVTGVNITTTQTHQPVMLVEQCGINFRNRLEQTHYARAGQAGQLDRNKVYVDMTKIYHQMIAAADQSGAGALILTPLSNGYFAGDYKKVMQGDAAEPGISYTAMFKAMDDYKKNHPQPQMHITTTVGDTLQDAVKNDLMFTNSTTIAGQLQTQVLGQVAIGIAAHDNDGTGKLYDKDVQADYSRSGTLPSVQEEAVKLQTNFDSDALQQNTMVIRTYSAPAAAQSAASTAGQGGGGAALATPLSLNTLIQQAFPAIQSFHQQTNTKTGHPETVLHFQTQSEADSFANMIFKNYNIKSAKDLPKQSFQDRNTRQHSLLFSESQMQALSLVAGQSIQATQSAASTAGQGGGGGAAAPDRPFTSQHAPQQQPQQQQQQEAIELARNQYKYINDRYTELYNTYNSLIQSGGDKETIQKAYDEAMDAHGVLLERKKNFSDLEQSQQHVPQQQYAQQPQQHAGHYQTPSVPSQPFQGAPPYPTAGGNGFGWVSPQPAPGQLGNSFLVFSAAAAARGANLQQQVATQQPQQLTYQSLATQGALSNYFHSNLGLPHFKHMKGSTHTQGDQVLVFNSLQEAQGFSRLLLSIDSKTFCKQGQPGVEKGTSVEHNTQTGGQIIMTAAQMERLMAYCKQAQNQQPSRGPGQ